jgi:hypothetical protein
VTLIFEQFDDVSLMAAQNRPGVRPQTLVAGEPVRCRYRIWIHRGRTDAEHLARAFAAYLAEPDQIDNPNGPASLRKPSATSLKP